MTNHVTTPEPFDLDHLDALHAASTPGPWGNHCGELTQKVPHADVPEAPWDFYPAGVDIVREGDDGGFVRREDLEFVAALRTAYPAMAAEIRRLRADAMERAIEELESLERWTIAQDRMSGMDYHALLRDEIGLSIAALRAEQPQAERPAGGS